MPRKLLAMTLPKMVDEAKKQSAGRNHPRLLDSDWG